MAREAYSRFKSAGDGVILNVIGTGGVRPTAGYIAGATANAGLIAFTEALGGESASERVEVAASTTLCGTAFGFSSKYKTCLIYLSYVRR